MAGKRDQVFVGLFVIVAAAVLIGMVFAISGAFGRTAKTYHAYFPFAGGLEQGATVRYAGGPKVGRVDKLSIDPKNPAQIDVVFSVDTDLPVKTDSHAKIMSMSPLGDNHLEILPGGAQAALAPPGSVLPADPYMDFNALTAQINDLAPQAKQLIESLNDRSAELKVTVERVNDLLNATNRENRADVRQAVVELRKSLTTLTDITGRLDQTLDVNTENIDELLDNFRRVSQNLKEFTNTIKNRPYTLIRATNPREHQPGAHQ
jgi:phospholipid/cholesterol/gamma-HCH transport system substrate-binding protein